MTAQSSYSDRVVASATWAAFGDALGFMAELIDAKRLKQRIGDTAIVGLVSWKKRVGGRFGPDVPLPKGCYSDDTQLRLATGRAIESDGDYNVEAFSKVELPVFLNYALGAGRGTKHSAAGLRRGTTTWSSNLDKDYCSGGGNGAAMRIQPHVWASRSSRAPASLLLDIARNTVCTHGHPRALVGAAFHALALRETLQKGEVVGPESWSDILNTIRSVLVPTLQADLHFSTAWLPEWSRHTGADFMLILEASLDECRAHLEVLRPFCTRDSGSTFAAAVSALDGFNPKVRGSGTRTAILASLCAWLSCSEPRQGLLIAANLLGSDTDTIGTMAGALLGAAIGTDPPERVVDFDYISAEARRLAAVSEGRKTEGFIYPDLLDWTPPRSGLECVGPTNGPNGLALAGLGLLSLEEPAFEIRGSHPALLRWAALPFGQKVLVKMRPEPKPLAQSQHPVALVETKNPKEAPLIASDENADCENVTPSIDSLTQQAINSGFDPDVVGRGLLQAAEGESGVEHAVAFAAIIAKAKIARKKRGMLTNQTRNPKQLEP